VADATLRVCKGDPQAEVVHRFKVTLRSIGEEIVLSGTELWGGHLSIDRGPILRTLHGAGPAQCSCRWSPLLVHGDGTNPLSLPALRATAFVEQGWLLLREDRSGVPVLGAKEAAIRQAIEHALSHAAKRDPRDDVSYARQAVFEATYPAHRFLVGVIGVHDDDARDLVQQAILDLFDGREGLLEAIRRDTMLRIPPQKLADIVGAISGGWVSDWDTLAPVLGDRAGEVAVHASLAEVDLESVVDGESGVWRSVFLDEVLRERYSRSSLWDDDTAHWERLRVQSLGRDLSPERCLRVIVEELISMIDAVSPRPRSWTVAEVEHDVRAYLNGRSWRSGPQMSFDGRPDLPRRMKLHAGLTWWKDRLGFAKYRLDADQIQRRLEAVTADSDRFHTQAQLGADEEGARLVADLRQVACSFGRGSHAWAKHLGFTEPDQHGGMWRPGTAPAPAARKYGSLPEVQSTFASFMAGRETFPTMDEMRGAGLEDLRKAMYKHAPISEWRRAYPGERELRRQREEDESNARYQRATTDLNAMPGVGEKVVPNGGIRNDPTVPHTENKVIWCATVTLRDVAYADPLILAAGDILAGSLNRETVPYKIWATGSEVQLTVALSDELPRGYGARHWRAFDEDIVQLAARCPGVTSAQMGTPGAMVHFKFDRVLDDQLRRIAPTGKAPSRLRPLLVRRHGRMTAMTLRHFLSTYTGEYSLDSWSGTAPWHDDFEESTWTLLGGESFLIWHPDDYDDDGPPYMNYDGADRVVVADQRGLRRQMNLYKIQELHAFRYAAHYSGYGDSAIRKGGHRQQLNSETARY